MTEQRLWVTAYRTVNSEVLLAHPLQSTPVILERDANGVLTVAGQRALDAARSQGAKVTFYSMPDPF